MWLDILRLLKALGGQALFLGFVALVAKSIASRVLNRDIETFKAKLKADADIHVEHLKSALEITAREHDVRFSRLHAKRAEVIDELYKSLVEAVVPAWTFVLGNPRDSTQYQAAQDKALHLYKFIELNRLYLPENVCTSLDAFVQKLRHLVIHVGTYWTQIDTPANQRIADERDKVLLDAVTALESDLPALRKQLEIEFRALLGGK